MTLLHQAAQKAVERIRHTLMTGLAHNDAIAALNELAALQQQPEPALWQFSIDGKTWCECLAESAKAAEKHGFQTRALYTAPPALQHQEVPREPVAWRYRYSPKQDWKLTSQPTTQWAADHSGFEEEPLYASLSTTRQQEAGSGWKLVPVEPTEEMKAKCTDGMSPGRAELWWNDVFAPAYRAMLAAAPSTPENAGGVGGTQQ